MSRVLLRTGGKPSTWLPPGWLVEQNIIYWWFPLKFWIFKIFIFSSFLTLIYESKRQTESAVPPSYSHTFSIGKLIDIFSLALNRFHYKQMFNFWAMFSQRHFYHQKFFSPPPLGSIENTQLLRTGGKLSIWLPPGWLVEQNNIYWSVPLNFWIL